jgi:ATP-dependent DNA helicase RecG
MSSIKIWTTDGLKAVAYPPETVWEVVVNAIIHRDYSVSDDVQVHIFDDRVVVSSPGRLPGYVTVDNILDARFARNPRVVGMLTRYGNPPNKDIGEGLNTAFQKMKEGVEVRVLFLALSSVTQGCATAASRSASEDGGLSIVVRVLDLLQRSAARIAGLSSKRRAASCTAAASSSRPAAIRLRWSMATSRCRP